MRRPLAPVLSLTVLAVVLAGCSGDAPATVEAAPVTAASPSVSPSPVVEAPVILPSPPVAPVTISPTPSASASRSPSAKPSPPKPSYDVAAVQRQLTDLKYYVGATDGRAGGTMTSALMAFQKVQGIAITGSVNAATLAALAAPRSPVLKDSSPANRVEVDLTKQVMYVVKGGAVSRILPVSSGNGATYEQKDGAKARALTPTGYYKIERRIEGERKADLGTLYDPQYFYRGWAIHGSNSVPAGPASHGCVRVTRADAKYLLGVLHNGMTVHLYGGKHVFSAGSSAPGTDSPTGDGAAAAEAPPAPRAPAPASSPAPAPASPTPARPSPQASPSPSGGARPAG